MNQSGMIPDPEEARLEYYGKVGDEHGLNSAWAITEVADLYETHGFPGAAKMTYAPARGKLLETPIIGDRWLDLYIAADKLISLGGNHDHQFIEAFDTGSDPRVLSLSTGS